MYVINLFLIYNYKEQLHALYTIYWYNKYN